MAISCFFLLLLRHECVYTETVWQCPQTYNDLLLLMYSADVFCCRLQMVFEGAGWNTVTVDMIRMSRAHCQFVLVKNFTESLDGLQSGGILQQQTLAPLRRLCNLFALTLMESNMGDFLEDGYMTGEPCRVCLLVMLCQQCC